MQPRRRERRDKRTHRDLVNPRSGKDAPHHFAAAARTQRQHHFGDTTWIHQAPRRRRHRPSIPRAPLHLRHRNSRRTRGGLGKIRRRDRNRLSAAREQGERAISNCSLCLLQKKKMYPKGLRLEIWDFRASLLPLVCLILNTSSLFRKKTSSL